ncbi:MAG: TlpA family protein disulfide reductase [gamma proteobacterium symbiont of Ctena orbiculata]|nr:MAG: TlpA family protein disulfide reductase [gamma proteobacterium symbiont of Ctena orbiculata]PUB90712.1 MAG: TlpA family protein disulfide reductase [gamma proteobacterium symbiont of Ctena orbiculata]
MLSKRLIQFRLHQFIVAGLLLLACGYTVAAKQPSMAPDFTLKSREGVNIKLSELRGQVVMVNFWASWCGPCRQEMPLLQQLFDRYQSLGFSLLGVNVDEDRAAADKMLSDLPVSFPILYDDRSKVSKQYQVKAMPSTFMVDRDGRIRYLHKGYKPGYEEEYQQQIRQLLRE